MDLKASSARLDLYDGIEGITLFLASLGEVTGEALHGLRLVGVGIVIGTAYAVRNRGLASVPVPRGCA